MASGADKAVQLKVNNQVADGARFATSAGMAATYTNLYAAFYSKPAMNFFDGVGQYIFFPVTLMAGIVQTVCSWHYAHVDRKKSNNKMKKRHVVTAVLDTVASVAFITATVGIMVSYALFSLATPAVFMTMIGGRALFNAGSALYWLHQSKKEDDPVRKEKLVNRAKDCGKSAFFGLVAFTATTCVFMMGYFFMAPIGIALNVFFLALGIVGIVKGVKDSQEKRKLQLQAQENAPTENSENELSDTAELLKHFDMSSVNIASLPSRKSDSSEPEVARRPTPQKKWIRAVKRPVDDNLELVEPVRQSRSHSG